MLRNRELLVFLLFALALAAAGTAVGFSFSQEAGLVAAATAAALLLSFVLFTLLRYRGIKKLSGYLRRVTNGEYSLDVRDNREGELSILKSEIYKVTVTLSEQSALLLEDKRRLADSLSDISHQLKTPLTSMLVMTDLLCEQTLPQQKREEFTRNLRAQLERMQWLLSSLLKLSRLDADTVVFRKDWIPIRQILLQAASPLLIPLELKGVDLTLEGPDELRVYADPNWLAEVFVNLFKNAAEHTPSGGRIAAFWQDTPLFYEIAVADNGAGIDREDLPHIFTRFHRGKNASPESVGIGLAMAKSIVEKQGGSITAQSRPGQGAVFFVRLYKA